MKFIHVKAEVTLMAVQFINAESFFLLRRFIEPKNPRSTARIAHFVFLRRSKKNMAAKFKGRVKKNSRKFICLKVFISTDKHKETEQ